MDIQELITWATEGLTEEQAKPVREALSRESVKSKAGGLRAQKELDDLQARETALRGELEGDGPQKPGAKAYKEWYDKNYAAVVKLQADQAKYVEKYGSLESPKTSETQPLGSAMTKEEIERLVDQRANAHIQGTYAPQWSSLLTSTGSIVQKHMFAGRKAPIDFTKLSEIASKYNGNLDQAYDEYDKPEREKEAKAAGEKEIERRVSEELQKRGASQHFPGDTTPGVMSAGRDTKSFDKAALTRSLVQTAQTGDYPKGSSKGAGEFFKN